METENHLKPPADKSEWDESQYLFPTYENDNLLSCLPDGDDISSAHDIISKCQNFPALSESDEAKNQCDIIAKEKGLEGMPANIEEAPVIPEKFPDESEKSIRESILFLQPEIRRSLTPKDAATCSTRSRGRGKLRRNE